MYVPDEPNREIKELLDVAAAGMLGPRIIGGVRSPAKQFGATEPVDGFDLNCAERMVGAVMKRAEGLPVLCCRYVQGHSIEWDRTEVRLDIWVRL